MAKRSIYFPDELENQMEKYQEENWSAVCQDAVATRLKFLAVRSEVSANAVERAKARLAAEKAAYIEDPAERGARAGAVWAADTATFDELRRLKASEGQFELDDDPNDELKAAKTLVWVLRPYAEYSSNEPDTEEVLAFLCEAGLDPHDDDVVTSAEFLSAFATAALTIYDQV